MDAVHQAPLLADFLKEPRGHASAKRGRQYRCSVEIRITERHPGKPEHQVQLFEVSVFAPLASGVARRLRLDRPLRRKTRKQLLRQLDLPPMLHIARGREHHSARAIVVTEIGNDGASSELPNDLRPAQSPAGLPRAPYPVLRDRKLNAAECRQEYRERAAHLPSEPSRNTPYFRV